MPRPRILFAADAVTLAHVARPAALARGLATTDYEVSLACDRRYRPLLACEPYRLLDLPAQSTQRFLHRAARGLPLYDLPTLREYLHADLALLDEVRPHAVIGDHRLSLAVSARKRRIPYLAITNAYWSPYAETVTPVPDLPMTHLLGVPLAQRLFDVIWPMAAAYHSWPLNRLRREHGLPPAGWDWRQPYTEADHVLYADGEALVPTWGRPAHHHYLGPILWSAPVGLPGWWTALPDDRPVVYLSLGSSGDERHLVLAIEALSTLPVAVALASAGKPLPHPLPKNINAADYLPGDVVCARANLVICNGGSLGVYQALAAGRPVLGIAAHMDQQLCMYHVQKAGVGVCLRSDSLDVPSLRAAIMGLLDEAGTHGRARAMARTIVQTNPVEVLQSVLQTVLDEARVD